jgi:hypothetical protein
MLLVACGLVQVACEKREAYFSNPNDRLLNDALENASVKETTRNIGPIRGETLTAV